MAAPLRGDRRSFDTAKIAHVAPAVDLRIAVEQFAPPSALRHADDIVEPRHRREIAHGDDRRAVARLAQKTDDALIGVAKVDPLETGALEIRLVERRLHPIKG